MTGWSSAWARTAYRYVGNGEKDGEWLRRQAAERDLDALVKSS